MTLKLFLLGAGVILIAFLIVLAACKWDFEKAFVVIIEALADLFD